MCDGNHLSTLDITPCTLLELKEITCGNQGQTLTLYVTQAQNDVPVARKKREAGEGIPEWLKNRFK